MADGDLDPVLVAYGPGCQPRRIEPLGMCGGLSGALFWKLDTPCGPLCLRRWPRGKPQPARLEFIHGVLRHAAAHGFGLLPLPLPTRGGRSCATHAGHLWELTPWLPGAPLLTEGPGEVGDPPRVAAALAALARFHVAAAEFPGNGPRRGPSPGIAARRRRLAELATGRLDALRAAAAAGGPAELAGPVGRILGLFSAAAPGVARRLDEALGQQVDLQPCLRDVWSGHVLLVGREVTGLIDFGAMGTDSVATDVARLLGSLAADEPHLREAGLEAYTRIRPLDEAERRLVTTFDRSGTLLGGLEWMEWVYGEGRQFDDLTRVGRRLRRIAGRLEVLSC